MWATILALLAAICWGAAPIAAKFALGGMSPMMGMAVRSFIATSMVTVWMLTTGAHQQMPEVNSRALLWLFLEALLATVVGDAFYFYAIKLGHAGQVSLILASSPLITLVAAVTLLGEPISTTKLMGAVLVVGGLALIGR